MSQPSRTPVPISRAAAAVVGFLARYSSKNTVSAFALDLRLLFQWCAARGLDPLEATRTDLELFARYLEDERGNGPATVHRRLSTITCFYRMAEIDGYLDRSPATHLRLPRVYRDETTTLGLDRAELGAILAAARASTASDAALITMLGLLGLRVSEACSMRIQDTHGLERGHRTLTLVGKGRKPATIPLPLAVAEVIDAAAGSGSPARCCCALMARRWTATRQPGSWSVWPRRLVSGSTSVLIRSGMPSSQPAWTLASRCVMCRSPPGTATPA